MSIHLGQQWEFPLPNKNAKESPGRMSRNDLLMAYNLYNVLGMKGEGREPTSLAGPTGKDISKKQMSLCFPLVL